MKLQLQHSNLCEYKSSKTVPAMVLSFFVPWCEDVDMGCGSHFGEEARWEGFCVGVGLVRFAGHGCVPESAHGFPTVSQCLTQMSCLPRHAG